MGGGGADGWIGVNGISSGTIAPSGLMQVLEINAPRLVQTGKAGGFPDRCCKKSVELRRDKKSAGSRDCQAEFV